MPMKKFSATHLSLEKVYQTSINLARKIVDSNYQADVIIAIARGGFPPARFLCDFLNIKNLQSIQVTHYSAGGEKLAKARVLSENLDNIHDKNILVVDDVNDSGETLSAVVKHFVKTKNVKTAVLHEKKNTKFKADYVAETLHEWKWLIYPWAVKEDVLEFLEKDKMLNAETDEALKHLENKYDLKIERPLLIELLKFKRIK